MKSDRLINFVELSPAGRRRARLACAGLLALFAIVAWLAIRTKSATADEPLHLVSALTHVALGDFRTDPEDPPLWKYWVSLPHIFNPPTLPTQNKYWPLMMRDYKAEWDFTGHALYRTPGNDADSIIAKSRFMMLLVAIALGALIATWSWKLAGPVAAIVATGIYSLDPNLLAHAALVKNDIAYTFLQFAVIYALWQAGNNLTIPRIAIFALLVGAAMATKFSGMILAPITLVLLIARAVLPVHWNVVGKTIFSMRGKLVVAIGLWIVTGIVSYILVWGSYGFRYSPTPDPRENFDIVHVYNQAASNQIFAANGGTPGTQAQFATYKPRGMLRLLVFIHETQLMPQSWFYGMMYTYMTTVIRQSYFLGETSLLGWRSYFPVAMFVKTPLSELLAIAASLSLTAFAIFRGVRGVPKRGDVAYLSWWTVLCLLLPMLVYGISAMSSALNIGIRHIFPMFPPLFILIGVCASILIAKWGRSAILATSALGLMLAIESLSAFPNFIAYFNSAAGGSRGGLRILSDSNLDWGQDIKPLAAWRKANPDGVLYLLFLGAADPKYYGIDYINLAPGFRLDDTSTPLSEVTQPGYIAVSAYRLQQVSIRHPIFDQLMRTEPVAILGGSLYIYRTPVGQ